MSFQNNNTTTDTLINTDFEAYFPGGSFAPSQNTARAQEVSDASDYSQNNHNGNQGPSSISDSPLDQSPLDDGFSTGYSTPASSRNTITTKPAQKKVTKRSQTNQKKSRFRPCDGCRKRRTKCSIPEGSKSCMECTKRNMECKFEFTTEQLVQSTGKDGAIVCDNCSHRRTTCVIPRNSNTCTECTLKELVCKFSGTNNSEIKIRTNIPIRDYDNYQGPTILKKTLSLQGSKSSKVLGPTSVIEKNLLNFNNVDDAISPSVEIIKKEQIVVDNSIKIRKINDDSIFEIVNDNEEFIKLSYHQVDEVEKTVYPYNLNLINLYFKIVHPLLPVVCKPVFMEKYSRTHREFDPILLCALYLQALSWWHVDDFLKDKPKPNFHKLERLLHVLYAENMTNLPPKLSTCQGLILLLNYDFREPGSKVLLRQNNDWKFISNLITICEELGLNYNSEDWITVPQWERKTRKILTWTIILMDKIYSLLEFRPSRISPDNWILNELNANDFTVIEDGEIFLENIDGENIVLNHGDHNVEEDEQSLYGNLIFVKMVHLSYHINDTLSEIYNLKSLKFDDFDTILFKSARLLQNLDEWYNSLPPQVRESALLKPEGQVSAAPLNLMFYTLKFLIYRRILNYVIETPKLITNDQYFVKFRIIFKKLFGEIRNFNRGYINNLTVEHFSNCFWYSNSTKSLISVVIVLLLLIKISKDELYIDDEYNYEVLNNEYIEYRENLRTIALDFTPARLALDHIDQFVKVEDGNLVFIL